MKKIFVCIILSIILFSCEPVQVNPPLPEPQFNCSIELSIHECPTVNCINPIDVANKRVEIYEDYYSLTQEMEPIYIDSTNQNGWVKFYDFACNESFAVKVDLGKNGVFIHDRSSFASTNEFISIEIRPNYFFDNSAWSQPIVQHVSLEYLTVGQWSRYNYFEVPGEWTFDASSHYVGGSLDIAVNNQLDVNTFLIGEHLTNANPTYFPDLPNSSNQFYTESTWRIQNDTLYVSNESPTNNIVSLIWSITEDEGSTQGEYAIPFNVESDNFLDLTNDFMAPNPAWDEVGFCSDFEYNSYLFENLMVELRDYSMLNDDASIKCLIYNPKDGLVRNIRFFENGQNFTAGFDLIVN